MHPTLLANSPLPHLVPGSAADPLTVLALAAGFLALVWLACCALLATGAAITTGLVLGLRHLIRTITHRSRRPTNTGDASHHVVDLDRYRAQHHRYRREPDDDPA